MAQIPALPVLFLVSAILLSGHLINGQTIPSLTETPSGTTESVTEMPGGSAGNGTETPIVITQIGCTSNAAAGKAKCADINVDDLNRLLSMGESMDYCSFSLQQYGCAEISSLPVEKAQQITSCFLQEEAVVTPETSALFISQLSSSSLDAVLDWIARTQNNLPPATKSMFLGGYLERISTDPNIQNPNEIGYRFQKISPFLDSISTTDFDCMLSYPTSCDGQKNIMSVLDLQYNKVSNETRRQTSNYASRFLNSHSCVSNSSALPVEIPALYRQYFSDVETDDLRLAFPDLDLSFALPVFNARQMVGYVQITNAFNSTSTASPVFDVLKMQPFNFNYDFLSNLPETEYSIEVMYEAASNIIAKQEETTDPLCTPTKKAVFQSTFNFIFQTVDQPMLERLQPKDCSEIRDIYQGFDQINGKLNEDQRELVSRRRYASLLAESEKSGLGCTYGYSSEAWLTTMGGVSVVYWTYAEIMLINTNFDGFKAMRYLNIEQTQSMVIAQGLFSEASPTDAESRIAALNEYLNNKGYDVARRWVIGLNQKTSMKKIVNVIVRLTFFKSYWTLVKSRFSSFTEDDWSSLFSDELPLASSSITKMELTDLPADKVKNCSNLRKIMEGLDKSYEDFDSSTATDIADFATDFMASQPDKCAESGGPQKIMFRLFGMVKIIVIQDLDPQFLENSYQSLSSNQMGEMAAVYGPARTDPKYITGMFATLKNGTNEQALQNIDNFYQSLNRYPDEANSISVEVKTVMRKQTIPVVAQAAATLTYIRIRLILIIRIRIIIIYLDDEDLRSFSSNPGCDFQRAFAASLGSVRSNATMESQRAVGNYMKTYLANDRTQKPESERCASNEPTTTAFINNYLAEYSDVPDYTEMKGYYPRFNVRESGVLGMLGAKQIGQMIWEEKVLQSTADVNWLFATLVTKDHEFIDGVMKSMTETYIQAGSPAVNAEAAQSMMSQYLQIMRQKISDYDAEETQQLFQYRLNILMPYATQEDLNLISMKDCNSLRAGVAQLNTVYSNLNAVIGNVVKWILATLKKDGLNGCSSDTTNSEEWIESNMKLFFQDASLAEVKEFLNLNVMEIMNRTSVSQKAEFLTSSPDALTDVTITNTVLDTILTADRTITRQRIITFYFSFNVLYSKLTVRTMTKQVKERIIDFTFTYLLDVPNGITLEQWTQLPSLMRYVIGGISVNTIQKIKYYDCNVFHYTIATLDVGFNEMSEDVAIAASNMVIDYLTSISGASGSSPDTCSSFYTDSRTYLTNIFFSFRRYISYTILIRFYSRFNGLSSLDLLTGTQMGGLLMESSISADEFKSLQVIAEIQKRSPEEIKQCMVEVSRVAKEKKIMRFTNVNVERMLNNMVWSIVTQTKELSFWFKSFSFSLLAPSSTADQIRSISTDTDCSSQQGMVQAFSDVISVLNGDQKSAVLNAIMDANTRILTSTGAACPTESGTDSAWFKQTFAEFKDMPSYAQIQQLNSNFSAENVLADLSPKQKAQVTIRVRFEFNLIKMLESIDSKEKMDIYLQVLNDEDGDELRRNPDGALFLNRSMELSQPEFPSLTTDGYKTLFQITLRNVLQNIKQEHLEKLPLPIDCSSYPEVLIGFNNVYDSLPEESRALVFASLIKPQMDGTAAVNGVKCGLQTDTVEIWLERNCGKFKNLAQISDFSSWNINFKVITMISTLSPTQAAEVAVNSINNDAAACQVAGRVEQFNLNGVYTFLDAFSVSVSQMNLAGASKPALNKFLGSSLKVVRSSFAFYNTSDWSALINNRFKPMIATVEPDQLTTIIDYTDCQSYPVVVSGLSDAFNDMTEAGRQGVYNVLSAYVKNKKGSTGFCPEEGEDSQATLIRLLGKFSRYSPFSGLSGIIVGFDWKLAASSLTAVQLAGVSFETSVLSNQDDAEVLNRRMLEFTTEEMSSYLQALKDSSDAKKIVSLPDASIAGMLYKTIADKMSLKFNTFSDEDWTSYMTNTNLFLPFMQAEQVNQIPSNIGCIALRTIVGQSGKYYEQQSGDCQMAISNKIKSVLETQKAATGSACLANVDNSGQWIHMNWGYYSEPEELNTFLTLNPGFSVRDALSYLTPGQLGYYMADSIVLSDVSTVETVLSSLSDVRSFLNSFNANMKAKGISGITNKSVRKVFSMKLFCELDSVISKFTASDYKVFFTDSLQYVLSSLDAGSFGFIPDLDCESLANIMGALNNVTNLENPADAYAFVFSQLKAIRSSTRDACVGGSDSKVWLSTYFGKLAPLGKYKDFRDLNPNFDAVDAASSLSSIELADAFTSSSITSAAMDTMVAAASSDLNAFISFVNTVRGNLAMDQSLTLSTSMKTTMLDAAAKNVFTEFSDMSSSEVGKWMDSLAFIFPFTVNTTYLQYIPTSISCESLAAVVSSLNSQFLSLQEKQRKEITDTILNILTAKASSGSCVNDLSLFQWIITYFGQFCIYASSEQLTPLFPSFNSVSYEEILKVFTQSITTIITQIITVEVAT